MRNSLRHLTQLGLAALAVVATASALAGCAPVADAKPVHAVVQHVGLAVVELHELRAGSSSLEETFLRLTAEPGAPPAPGP